MGVAQNIGLTTEGTDCKSAPAGTMKSIRSRIDVFFIYIGIVMLLPLVGFVWYFFSLLSDIIFSDKRNITYFLLLLFFVFMFLLCLNFVKHIRYIIIKNNKLRYYSILRPWGKCLDFSNYIGKVISYETGSGGSYKVVYLVDKHRRTAVKLMGLWYKNFEEIDQAIPLNEIKFTPTVRQYLGLLFFERITIPEKKPKTGKKDKKEREQEKQKEKRFFIVFLILKILGFVGIGLFIIGSIIKMLSKLL